MSRGFLRGASRSEEHRCECLPDIISRRYRLISFFAVERELASESLR